MNELINKIVNIFRTKKLLITAWQCDNCGEIYRTTEKDLDISCKRCRDDKVFPIDEYYEKLQRKRNWYWNAVCWHFQWVLTRHKPRYNLFQEVLGHVCSKYVYKHVRRNQRGDFVKENYLGKMCFRILSKVEYALRTGKAWWLNRDKIYRKK